MIMSSINEEKIGFIMLMDKNNYEVLRVETAASGDCASHVQKSSRPILSVVVQQRMGWTQPADETEEGGE
jgi:hypothetical protein